MYESSFEWLLLFLYERNDNMFISDNGLNLIKKFEGCILQSYDDFNNKVVSNSDIVKGTLTIGYGHTEGVFKGQAITRDQAEEMLKRDMIKYCNQVDEVINDTNIPFTITQGVYDAFVSFDYNVGQGCLRTLLANGTRDKQTGADMMLEYRNKGSQWEEGLLRRRQAEIELFLTDGVVNNASTQINLTLRDFQQQYNMTYSANITVDGLYGPETEKAINNTLIKEGQKNSLVGFVQCRVGATLDYIFGPVTKQCVVVYQNANGLSADGIAGSQTFRKLLRL